MPAVSLQNMSVATDQAQSNGMLLMPKLQYRFRVDFFNFGVDPTEGLSLTKQVMDCTRPQVTFDEVTLNVYNSRVYLPGKHTWTELTVNIRDDATGTVAKACGAQLQKQLDFFEQASAAAGSDYKFTTRIQILDGGNGAYAPQAQSGGIEQGILETWECYGCFLKMVNYNTLNYAESQAVTMQLQIRYDNALQTPLGTGVGASIGRVGGASFQLVGAAGDNTNTL